MLSPHTRAGITVALALAAVSPCFAQSAASNSASPGALVDGSANPYHITDSQQAEITNRKLKFQQDASIVANDPTLTVAQKNQKISQMELKAAADVKAVLTPSQRAQVDADQAKVQANADAHSAQLKELQSEEQVDETRYKATKKALIDSLSTTQMSQILTLEQTTKAKLDQIQNDSTLTADQKSTQGAAVLADHNDQQKALFTPAQIALVHKMEDISADGSAKTKEIDAMLPPIVLPVK
jgi:hypothetical protein